VLALDYGSARCGVAISDPTGVLASPLEPVLRPSSKAGGEQLLALIESLEVERVLVGLPLSLSGADSAQTREVRKFAAWLGRKVAIPVELYDERFTTKMAQRDAGGSGARASEDSRAAAHLLSGWLARGSLSAEPERPA
jgi:putative Holliday junction resolvase